MDVMSIIFSLRFFNERVFPMNYFVKSYKVSIRVFFFRCVLSSIFGEDNIGKLVFRFWERNGRDTVVRDKG